MADPNNSVNLGRMTEAELRAAYQNGTLTPEQARAARQLHPELAKASSGNGSTPLGIETGTFAATVAATADAYGNIAVADLADGGGVSAEIADSGAVNSSDTGESYAATNPFDPYDSFDGIGDLPKRATSSKDDGYGGAGEKLPLEERLKLRAEDAKRHPERFGHRLFAGTKPPADDKEDKARIEFAHKAKAALAAGPEAVEKLLADPNNRALIDSASSETIASNLRKLTEEKANKPDPAKQNTPNPTKAKPTTPAKEAAAKRVAGSANDQRVPIEAHGRNYKGKMPRIVVHPDYEQKVAANGQQAGKPPTPDQEHGPSPAAKKDLAQQYGQQPYAKKDSYTPVLGLAHGPAGPMSV